MSDTEQVDIVFNDEPGSTVEEVVELSDGVVDDPENDGSGEPKKISLTPEEYKALKEQGDTAAALAASVSGLATQLSRPEPVNRPPAAPPPKELSDEEFIDQLLKPGEAKKLIASLVQQGVSQQTSTILVSAQQQNRRMLKLDPETKDVFNRFEKEIEAEIQALPPDHPARMRADLYELAYQTVYNKNQNIIIAERSKPSEEVIEAEVQKRLKELGVSDTRVRRGAAVYSESAPGVRPTPKPKTIRLTPEDKQAIEDSCLNWRDPDVAKEYLARKAARQGGNR